MTLEFAAADRIGGRSGCNRYGRARSGRRACKLRKRGRRRRRWIGLPDLPQMAMETAFLARPDRTPSGCSADNGALVLEPAGGGAPTRAPATRRHA